MSDTTPTKPTPLFPILAVNFIGTLGISIVVPFFVYLVTRFGGNAFVYGIMAATYPTFQLIGAPILGRWSDIHGRKRILLFSQLGTTLSWVIFCVALFLPVRTLIESGETPFGVLVVTLPLLVLFIARAFDGLTGGNVSVANAYLSDITPPEHRSENFGKMSISSNLGFVLGPALAGLLGATALGEALPALAALAVSIVAVLMIALRLPESRPKASTPTPGQKKPDHSFRAVLGQHCVGYSLVLYFLIFLGFSFFYTAFPVHAVVGLEWPVSLTGVFFAVLSLLMIIVQGPVLKWASQHYSESALVMVGCLILAGNFALLTSTNLVLVYGAATLFALGNGLMWPSFLSLLSKVAGDELQGSVQGFGSSAGSAASIIGLVMGGILYDQIGAVTFLVSAATMVVVCVLSVRVMRLERRAFHPPIK